MKLSAMKPGQKGTVISVSGSGNGKLRLLDLGFVPGTKVIMIKRAPSGNPIEVWLRGYNIALRRENADKVEVSERDDCGTERKSKLRKNDDI